MEMNDEIRLEASRAAVWAALNDPEVLKACIPGCETLEKVSDTEFVALVVAKVGPIKARFAGKVTLEDIVPQVSYRLVGEGQGGVAGFASADITVGLQSEGPSATLLSYGVTANIGGKIAQLGSRLIDSTARKMADQFFASFNQAVGGVPDETQGGTAAQPASELAAVAPAPSSAAAASAAAPAPASALANAGEPTSVLPVVASGDIVVTLVDVAEELEVPAEVAVVGGGSWLARLFGGGARPSPAKPVAAGTKSAARYQAALVTLNRPKQRNAVSLEMWRELARVYDELSRNPKVRGIILTGAGGNFSAGADISEFGTVRATVAQGTEYEVAVDACCDAIAASPKPTIAVISGFCMGGACHLAMSCDFRFFQSDAQFGIPAARLSIVYGLRATQRLLALVGIANAKQILYTAKKYDAAQALRFGFADRVAADPLRAAKSFAASMADNAPLTIAGTKVLLNGLTMGMGSLSDGVVEQAIARAVGSDDYRDATRAFVAKRQPVFLGN